MVQLLKFALPLLFSVCASAYEYEIGEAPGMAAGTTGGAGGREVTPKSTDELVNYLSSDEKLVVIIDRKFDFRGTEGTGKGKVCASHYSKQCPDQAQYVIIDGDIGSTGGCDGGFTSKEYTWDLAGQRGMHVESDKTIRGIEDKGEIIGKGLRVLGNNVIIQNVYIHDINPQFVWGGDAISIDGRDNKPVEKLWVDHVKIKNIGRQMFVAHYGGAKSATVSNSDFDGRTPFSASCDHRHYWTFLIYGTDTSMSIVGNYVHSTSGRSPKVKGDNGRPAYVHVANNYWQGSSRVFELGEDGYVVAEGNYFENDVWQDQSKANFFFATPGSQCGPLGRQCEPNVLEGTTDIASSNGGNAVQGISKFDGMKGYKPIAARKIANKSGFFGVNGVHPYI